MNAIPCNLPIHKAPTAPSRPDSMAARAEMEHRFAEHLLLADWLDLTFLHFEVDPDFLRREVPFPLDLFEGRAYVSLVAFTMKNMRFARGGAFTEWITRPMAMHRFLNLRTYVRHQDGTGIFFMHEWLNHRLAVALGPLTFGLPYHHAQIDYRNQPQFDAGEVHTQTGNLGFLATKSPQTEPTAPHSLDEFLLERYTAFTGAGKKPKFFRVWHQPWEIGTLDTLTLRDTSLLEQLNEDWTTTMKPAGGHWSNGVRDVWMGRPHHLSLPTTR